MSLARRLAEHKLVVCVGSGGVGKTTTAASVGLWAALEGRRALVLTIDPARRLANALGLQQIGNTEVQIPVAELTGEPCSGQLWAMMLDPASTLHHVIERVAKDPAQRQAIANNRIYQNIAGSFSGSQEYMATEQLYEVYASGRYDVIVLDTPPVKNALDFLEAPGRMARFLDKQVMRLFLTPLEEEGTLSKRFVLSTSAVVYRLLGHIFGKAFLTELTAFFTLFKDLYDGMRERHEAVIALFGAPTTTFLVVAGPNEPSTDVAGFFLAELRERRLGVSAVVVNQCHRARFAAPDPESELPSADADPVVYAGLRARLGAAHRRLRDLAQQEAGWISALRAKASSVQLIEVDRQAGEVHDVRALLSLHRFLFFPSTA